MALQSITNVNIDFVNPEYLMINAKQYDDCSRLIYITCYDNGKLYNLSASKHTAYIKFRKADGRYVFRFCDIDYKGRILVELTEQMLAATGICRAEIKVINKGSAIVDADTGEIRAIDNTSVLTTMTFYVTVYETTVDDSQIESDDDFLGLNDTLELLTADFSDAIQKAKSWAVGTNNDAREDDEEDNSKYYSKLSRSYAIGDAGSIRVNENTDNSKYYSQQSSASASASQTAQSKSEAAQKAAETAQDLAETAQGLAEAAQNKAETAQSLAETAQSKAEAAQGLAEVAQAAAESAQSKSEEAQGLSETAQSLAETAQSLAEVAQQKSEEAQSKSEIAQGLAETAQSLAETAQSNAELAEQNAANNVTLAESWAIGGTGKRDGEDENNAKYYSNKALESASNVEANADVIANAAEQATSSASNAANSAEDASTSAGEASDKASEASTFASEASASANAASESATNASSSASEAHTYYLQVEEITTGLSGAFMPKGTIEFAELATLLESGEVQAGYLYNISNNFTSDETFKRVGVEYAAGTNVYMTSDGVWDCLASTTVTGVKGNNETEYRKGNVNITVENIGAVASTDVATVDEVISYLGI